MVLLKRPEKRFDDKFDDKRFQAVVRKEVRGYASEREKDMLYANHERWMAALTGLEDRHTHEAEKLRGWLDKHLSRLDLYTGRRVRLQKELTQKVDRKVVGRKVISPELARQLKSQW